MRAPSAVRAPIRGRKPEAERPPGSARRSAIRVVGASSVIVTPAAKGAVIAFMLLSILRR